MAYKLYKIGTQANVQIREYICDSVDDLANLPADTPFGSTAFCIGSSETYTRASNGEYVKKTAGGGGVTPTGTLPISITSNGTTTEDVTEYANAEITVNTDPAKGLVFGDYDSDGYPHSARFVGTWTEIPTAYLRGALTKYNIAKNIKSLEIPNGITTLNQQLLEGCNALTSVDIPSTVQTFKASCLASCEIINLHITNTNAILEMMWARFNASIISVVFDGSVNAISQESFNGNTKTELYDFSHCSAIPPLYSVASLGHKAGCVIRIPAALSDTTLGTGNGWESALNWDALTNIVWEVV